jgi:hypothetical protein
VAAGGRHDRCGVGDVVSGELKVGDVCVIQLPSGSCEACQRRNGSECTIVGAEFIGVRISCGGKPEVGRYFLVECPGVRLPMALHRTELRKKPPKADDEGEPRADFTPADPDFREDLQRRLTKQTESA